MGQRKKAMGEKAKEEVDGESWSKKNMKLSDGDGGGWWLVVVVVVMRAGGR